MNRFTGLAAALLALFAITFAGPALAQTDIDPPAGAWTHRATSVQFPASVGEYVRGRITEFDDEGKDASVGYSYRNGNGILTVTVYVYPAWPGSTCAEELESTKAPIEKYPGIRLISEGTALPPNGMGARTALTVRYHIPENAMREGVPAVVSDAYLFCPPGDQWLVKYRASWTGTDATFPDVSQFMRGFAWPALLRGN